jgi:hypothetical protein
MTPEIRARILRLSAWFLVLGAAVAALPVGISAVTLPACESCHEARDLVGTVTSPAHLDAGARCVDCHVGTSVEDRVRFGFYQAYGMVVPILSTKDTLASVVADGSCTSCHQEMSGTWTAAGLRIRHEECAQGSACVDCHSNTAHVDAISWPKLYDMDACLRCHDAEDAYDSCDTCHVGRLERTRPTTGAWAVTHGSDWQRTHGMGEMSTCRACHAEGYCTPCHGPGVPHDDRFFARHGRESTVQGSMCTGCHEPAFCSDCHGVEMPHPTAFTREHSSLVGRAGDSSCRTCHAPSDCVVCHEKHVHPGGSIPLSLDGRTRP